MEVKIIEYKNKKILYADYRGAQSEEDIINTAQRGLKLREESSEPAGVIANFTGVDHIFSEGYIRKLKNSINTYGKDKIALIGMSVVDQGLTAWVAALVRTTHVRLFDAETEAKEWLASETDK